MLALPCQAMQDANVGISSEHMCKIFDGLSELGF